MGLLKDMAGKQDQLPFEGSLTAHCANSRFGPFKVQFTALRKEPVTSKNGSFDPIAVVPVSSDSRQTVAARQQSQ
jgi:hypothetical protein